MTIVPATGEPWEWDVPERDEDGRIVPENEDDGEDAVSGRLTALWRTAAAGLVVAVVGAELVIRGRAWR